MVGSSGKIRTGTGQAEGSQRLTHDHPQRLSSEDSFQRTYRSRFTQKMGVITSACAFASLRSLRRICSMVRRDQSRLMQGKSALVRGTTESPSLFGCGVGLSKHMCPPGATEDATTQPPQNLDIVPTYHSLNFKKKTYCSN